MTLAIEIIEAGIASTVQDHGRPGLAHIGVPRSGAVDEQLASMLNRLVGNPADAAVIETCGNLRLRALRPILVASTAEPAPRTLRPGHEFVVPHDGRRQWNYVAVRGGIDVATVLGSRSCDTLSSIGHPPLTVGARLGVGEEPTGRLAADLAPIAPVGDIARLTPGPRSGWFAADWPDVITSSHWTVTSSSRIGVRLRGAVLRRSVDGELPSEGLVSGAIQVPLDGDPIMMLADHPTTGGYPVIAVVHPDDVALVAQHPAGTSVRFRM